MPKSSSYSYAFVIISMVVPSMRLRAEGPLPTDKAPDLPAWARVLQGEDAYRAADLAKREAEFLRQERFGDAATVAKEILVLRARLQGADHWETINARWEVAKLEQIVRLSPGERQAFKRIWDLRQSAIISHTKGQHRESQAAWKDILAATRKVFGEDHPETARCYHNLALNLRAQGQYLEAERFNRKALDICLKVFGEDHPDTAASYDSLSLDLNLQGKDAETERNCRKGLAISRKVLGEEHPDTAASYNNVAMILSDLGRYAEAELAQRRVLVMARNLFGEDDPRTAASYNNLAQTLDKQGRHAEAEEYYRRSLAIRRKVLREKHRSTAIGFSNLAHNLDLQTRYAEAEQHHRTALAIQREVLGEEHPHTSTGYSYLAVNLDMQGRHIEAEQNHRMAVAISSKVHGNQHPDTAACHNNLSTNLRAQGRFREAEEEIRNCFSVSRTVTDENHPSNVIRYTNLAFALDAQGRYVDAEEDLTKAAKVFLRCRHSIARSGLDRASKASPLPRLAAVLARNGKPDLAWQRLEEGLGRSTWDEIAARLRRSPEDQARLNQLECQLKELDRIFDNLKTDIALQQEQQRRDLLIQRQRIQDDLDQFDRHLEEAYGVGEGMSYTLKELQAVLPIHTAFIAWLDFAGHPKAKDPNGEHWAVVVRSKGAPSWVRMPGSGPDNAWTESDSQLPRMLRQSLAAPPVPARQDWRVLAERLARQRLEPLLKLLSDLSGLPPVRHLVVLPSDVMDGIPLDVLTDRFTVSRAPSATLYTHLRSLPLYSQIAAAVNLLTFNPYKPVRMERIECETHLIPGRHTAEIEAIALDSETYSPGDTLKATVYLLPYKGTRQRLPVTLQLPADLPEGSYSVLVCDDLTNVRRQIHDNPNLSSPQSLDQIFETLNVQTSVQRTHVVVRVPLDGVGVALDGSSLPDLPPSMVQILGNTRKTGAQTMSGALVGRHKTNWVIQGAESARFTVTKNKKLSVP